MTMPHERLDREHRTVAIRQSQQARTREPPPAAPVTPFEATTPARRAREATTMPEYPRPAPSPASPATDQAAADRRIGQYELIRTLGQGGMGAVYLARDLRLGRLVAIKFLTEQSADGNERVLAEARATARCNHENIVIIHDVGEHAGCPYMVFEYVEGQTLSTWMREHARLQDGAGQPGRSAPAPVPPSLAVELMLPVVRALVYAHDLGIVHRDLKPANIMLTHAGTIKVLDFGIAKLLAQAEASSDHHLRPPGMATRDAIIGTPPYMSPEQLEGEGVDHRTDLWAVGIMLFELVTGTHPFLSRGADQGTGGLPGILLDVIDLDVPMPSVSERQPNIGDLGPLASIIDRCLIKDKAHRTSSARVLLQELEALSTSRRAVAPGPDDNPFAGLAAFQEADAHRFHGRTHEIASLATRLRSQPLLAIAGPSGVGKSSLVRAGIIPALKRSGEGWDACIVRPGRQPLAALVDVLVQLSQASTRRYDEHARATISADLRTAPGQLGAALRAWARNKRRRLVLFIDQFEELYTLCTDAAEISAFVACLDSVADDASSPLRVILSVRSDFLDRMAEHRDFMPEVSRGLVFLPPLSREGLREALTRPVEAADHRYEHPDMVEHMLDAVAATPGALPLLQFAASKLWTLRDRTRRLLTMASYQAMGGIAGTLASHADTVLASMTASRLARVRAIFERLVTPERTRAIATLAELRELPGNADELEQVVQHLVDARLLVIEAGEGDARTVELVHESLIQSWPTLARWLDDNQDQLAFLARVRASAQEWHRSGQAQGMLWRDQIAEDARDWYARYQGELTEREQQYLHAVLDLADRSQRRRRYLVSGTITVLTLLVVAAVAVIVQIEGQNRTIREQLAALQQGRSALAMSERAKEQARQAAQQAEGEATLVKQEVKEVRASAQVLEQVASQAQQESRTSAQAEKRALERAEAMARAEKEARELAELHLREAEQARLAAEQARDQERKAKEDLQKALDQERARQKRLRDDLGGGLSDSTPGAP